MRTLIRKLSLLVLLMAVQGCRTNDPIPTYASESIADSFQIMRVRSGAVENLSGDAWIVLRDAQGSSIVLEGAFAIASAQKARIRASKFGQAVLDLTVDDKDIWLVAGSDDRLKPLKSKLADNAASIRSWLGLLIAPLNGEDATIRGRSFIVTKPLDDGTVATISVDRRTLTTRRIDIHDREGAAVAVIEMSDYRPVGPTVWPLRIDATLATGEVHIHINAVEANTAEPAALTHPRRAERLP